MDGRFVGVDAGRTTIEVAVRPSGEKWKGRAGDDAITELAGRLQQIGPELVVLEGTGSFELPIAGVLATSGLPFAIVNPRSVREFARAIGRVGKLDQTQAGLLAQFAELVKPEARPLSIDVVQQLKELRDRRNELLQMLTAERSRLNSATPVVHKDVQRHMDFLERSISMLDEQFNRTVRASAAWR